MRHERGGECIKREADERQGKRTRKKENSRGNDSPQSTQHLFSIEYSLEYACHHHPLKWPWIQLGHCPITLNYYASSSYQRAHTSFSHRTSCSARLPASPLTFPTRPRFRCSEIQSQNSASSVIGAFYSLGSFPHAIPFIPRGGRREGPYGNPDQDRLAGWYRVCEWL